MNGTNLFKIAMRALVNNKLRAFLTMLGIIIGVASVITMLANWRIHTRVHHSDSVPRNPCRDRKRRRRSAVCNNSIHLSNRWQPQGPIHGTF